MVVNQANRSWSLKPEWPEWAGSMTEEDKRAITALFWSDINPYGIFLLDMETRLDLATELAE